ncbi:DUF2809 domain-containing protein [Algibacter miyuki]|uniref:DUF2809 domain-containing protein n=1 Tax=Algibacter miyuki TaxID=1306933 RepID=A0ABV5GXM6_9FLAO|nr:DUF2809 domain-containing protein [Algibacter miyuki]MDN3665919.1 DUF2809 domain-containing protein [Algibacter miyuki]
MIFRLNKHYASLCVLLLLTEIYIALFLKTGFIRYTFGDFLSVILLYCFFKSFLKIDSIKLAVNVLKFAFVIEFMQFFHVLKLFHLENNRFLSIVLGSTYQTSDLLAYTIGVIAIVVVEHKVNKLCIV